MTKEVLVSIVGLQLSAESLSEDQIEVIAPGEFYNRNNKSYVVFDEVSEEFDEPTKNVIKFAPNYMEVTKKGPSSVHMVFETGKKTVTYYYSPFGGLHIGIDTKKVEINESQDFIKLKAEYNLEINFEYVASCDIVIDITAKGSKEFKLIK